MNFNGYEIIHFQPEMREGALDVLAHLWGDNQRENLFYFQWKYIHNPHTDRPLGIIAMKGARVVGFRGYFATRWRLTESGKEIIILSPGDTCVHPDHRRKNLSMAMGSWAMEEYASQYPVFLNFSAGKNSVPGYLKMGFAPIADKVYLNQCTVRGMIRFLLSSGNKVRFKASPIPVGDYGEVAVSDRPKPEDMAAVVSGPANDGKKMQLIRDEAFFRWRFNNQRNRYVFYYFKRNHQIAGYAVIRRLEKNGRGFIIDYGAKDSESMAKVLAFLIKNKHFTVLSIIEYSVDDFLPPLLKRLKFRRKSVIGMLEKKVYGQWPLLVRPVRKTVTEKDFLIGGLDIRDIRNWSLKEICSDGS